MSLYQINKAKKLQKEILNLEQELRLNKNALEATKAAKSGKHIVEELEAKDRKLKKKLEKATKRFYSYADVNLKISDLSKLDGVGIEEPFDEEEY